jgi:hypothetical protein
MFFNFDNTSFLHTCSTILKVFQLNAVYPTRKLFPVANFGMARRIRVWPCLQTIYFCCCRSEKECIYENGHGQLDMSCNIKRMFSLKKKKDVHNQKHQTNITAYFIFTAVFKFLKGKMSTP